MLDRRFYLPVPRVPHVGVAIERVVDGNLLLHLLRIEDDALSVALSMAIEQYQVAAVWRDRLEKAVNKDQVRLYTQPIVPLQGAGGDTPPVVEVLMRLSEGGKIVSAGEFIGYLSRDPELLRILDRYNLYRICHYAATTTRYAVNLSGASLEHFSLVERVERLLERSHIAPENLWLEITEQVLLDHDAATKTIAGLQALGCKIFLDDYGSGWCSQNYILKLCKYLSGLKLDGAAIRALPSDCARSVLRSNLTLAEAQTPALIVVAEQVESAEVLEEIRSIAREFPSVPVWVQGYYLGGVEPWI